MTEIPPGMLRNSRPRDDAFDEHELLYRRVDPNEWNARRINRAAIGLPDMSVIRSKYGYPEWARLEGEEYAFWAVIGFRVGDMPQPFQHQGVEIWSFDVRHVPLDENYPHSEVRALKDNQHVNAKRLIPPEVELRYRDQLSQKCRTVIPPNEHREIRQAPPPVPQG